MIDKTTEQTIKDAANIVDVIGDFLTLKKRGSHFETLCPFHDDRRLGSFVVSPSHNCFVCYSCGAKGGPIEFLMKHQNMTYPDALRWLAQKYGIFVDEEQKKFDVKASKPVPLEDRLPPDLPPRLWPARWVDYYTTLDTDNLVRWLRRQPWDDVQRARLREVLKDYRVGHTSFAWKGEWHEWTIFWQLDADGILHNGHLMKYREDGHRDKATDYNQTWLHARMKYADHDKFDERVNSASYCLFGEHLLTRYPEATVNVVESEKTALIMATAYGNNATQLWVACAGSQNLNAERLAPLIKGKRRIVLFPDRDGIQLWAQKANQLGYAVEMNTQAVKQWWRDCDGPKADIADVVLRIINERNKSALEKIKEKNPAVAMLAAKFNLQ